MMSLMTSSFRNGLVEENYKIRDKRFNTTVTNHTYILRTHLLLEGVPCWCEDIAMPKFLVCIKILLGDQLPRETTAVGHVEVTLMVGTENEEGGGGERERWREKKVS